MSDDSLMAGPSSGATPPPACALPAGLVKCDEGVYFDAALTAPALLAAVDAVFLSGRYFVGLDYPVFIKALYQIGPALPATPLVRLAFDVASFDARRLPLYQGMRVERDSVEYCIERPDPSDDGAAPPVQEQPDFDELIAIAWSRGVRFGIDAQAVKALIAGKLECAIVARRLEPVAGRNALIVELSPELHRSHAPREMANGRLDLLSFKGPSPIRKNMRLLKKQPAAAGLPGYELSGEWVAPTPPRDVDLARLAGPGTIVEAHRDGDVLLSARDGFLNVDHGSGLISVDTTIISHDGVSSRTTGNLHLNAGFEEFGEVQEQRLIDGSDITVHGDVFGNISSRGGDIVLHSNVIGGSVLNADGAIRIKGMASGSVLQAKSGEVRVQRAESCVISGSRVVIEHASNCEIIADEVCVTLAEGCAIAGRSVDIGRAGPRKYAEMLVFALVPRLAGFDRQIADLEDRATDYALAAVKLQHEIDLLGNGREVHAYLALAERVRKHALQLTPEQALQFHAMTTAIGPELKNIGKLRVEAQAMLVQKEQMLEQVQQTRQQKRAVAAQSRCVLGVVDGELLVRTLPFDDDEGSRIYHHAPKDIKAMLRGANAGADIVFSGASGTLDWSFDPGARHR